MSALALLLTDPTEAESRTARRSDLRPGTQNRVWGEYAGPAGTSRQMRQLPSRPASSQCHSAPCSCHITFPASGRRKRAALEAVRLRRVVIPHFFTLQSYAAPMGEALQL